MHSCRRRCRRLQAEGWGRRLYMYYLQVSTSAGIDSLQTQPKGLLFMHCQRQPCRSRCSCFCCLIACQFSPLSPCEGRSTTQSSFPSRPLKIFVFVRPPGFFLGLITHLAKPQCSWKGGTGREEVLCPVISEAGVVIGPQQPDGWHTIGPPTIA